MTLKTLALASAASLALCAGANGAWAQQTDPSQYSSPAEQAQTQQLNAQNADGVDASPQELNGQGAPDQSDQGYGNSQPQSAQRDQYNQQLQINQQQQMQYQQQSAQYQAQYGDNPPPSGYQAVDYPPAPPYQYSNKLWSLGRIAQPSQQLAQLPIEGPDGRWVGRVRNVDVDSGGFARRLEVALDSRHSVWVQAGRFRYDARERVLFTPLSYDQLWNHPGATVESDEP